MKIDFISSKQNPRVKAWARLRSKKSRTEQKLFLLDGFYELKEALRSQHQPKEILFCRELWKEDCEDFIEESPYEFVELSASAFEHLAYRENADGWIAVFEQFSYELAEIKLSSTPLFLLAENMEKPGNLGAMMRSAEAAGADAIITTGQEIDLFNPNALYSSRALLFHLPVIQTTNAAALAFFQQHRVQVHATFPSCPIPYWEKDFSQPVAFALGSESDGLTPFWNQETTSPITIPMNGSADSLNLSNTAAILLFEALRQRAGKR